MSKKKEWVCNYTLSFVVTAKTEEEAEELGWDELLAVLSSDTGINKNDFGVHDPELLEDYPYAQSM